MAAFEINETKKPLSNTQGWVKLISSSMGLQNLNSTCNIKFNVGV